MTESIIWSSRIAAQFVLIFLISIFLITELIPITEPVVGLVDILVVVLTTQPITALVTKLITELAQMQVILITERITEVTERITVVATELATVIELQYTFLSVCHTDHLTNQKAVHSNSLLDRSWTHRHAASLPHGEQTLWYPPSPSS